MQALYYISLISEIALCSGVDTPETGESATDVQEYMNVTAILRGTPRSSMIPDGRYVESGADLVIPWTELLNPVPKELPDYDYDDDGTVEDITRENGVETVKDFVYTDAEDYWAYYLKRIDMRAVKTTDLLSDEQRKQYAFRTRETIGARPIASGMFSRVPLVLRTLDNDRGHIVDQSDVVADVVPVAKSTSKVPDGATRPHLGYMCVGKTGADVQYPQKSTMNEFYKLIYDGKLSTVTLNAMRLTTALLLNGHSTGFAQENF
ncbi:putative virion structural protein [Salmonella phage SPFM10]|nr:putative virion structural protein [Salmonella phage SPFM10]